MEAQQELDALLLGSSDVADLPQLVPGARVAVERLVEVRVAADAALPRLSGSLIPRSREL